MERYVKIRHLRSELEREPTVYMVFLEIGNQRFCIGPDSGWETLAEAEWHRDMLCIALDKIEKAEPQ